MKRRQGFYDLARRERTRNLINYTAERVSEGVAIVQVARECGLSRNRIWAIWKIVQDELAAAHWMGAEKLK